MREEEATDLVLEAVAQNAQSEVVDSEMMPLAPMRKKASLAERLAEAVGKASSCELRIPGAASKRRHEGPQVKLRLCEWYEDTVVALGGGPEAEKLVIAAVGEQWDLQSNEVRKLLAQNERAPEV